VNNSGIPENNEGDILYNTVKNNLIPRLKGKLGKTLMGLDYTGNYINIEYQEQPPEDNEQDYLSIQHYGMSYFWHAGFFNYNNFPDNKYFLLTNLRVNYDVEAKLIVSNNTGYENVSFTDIEGGIGRIDTTIGINSSISHYEIIPKGEGRLYRVAPVIKFGGRLLYPEVTQPGMTLQDDMIIENGATMTVYSTYTANANITVKHGTIQLGENGKIIFGEGKKLIVEGACTISGTSGDKLQLVFSEPLNDEEPTGIMIKAGGSLTINNCKIENATIGIESLLNANYLNVQNVDFINCSDIAVSIAGYGSNQILTPPTPQIMYCTIQNSKSGIWATNLSQIVIRENQLMNTDLGVFLSNVSTSAVIGNTFTGTKKSAGVFLESCNGVVRGNWITNHSNGIHLANSSPDIGGNSIFHNWNRAIYVGFGSLPNMEGKLVQDPAHLNLFYAVSGYNRIYENGGWTPEDDGSEIYVDFANVVLRRGCNQIYDSRTPNTNDTPPLYNTQLLMNCSSLGYPIEIYAEHNYWGDHSIYLLEARFGDCDIYYEPFLEQPCPEPDRSGSKLLITSATGETVDTLYEEQRTIGTLTETEEQYSIAEETFLTGDLVGALQIYETIITGNVSEEEKYFAYQRKYEIGRLTYESSEFFNDMHNTFIALASNADDSLSMKRLTQLSTLSKVGEQEYEMAIGEFDGIVQQNPNTEEAAYAEIDALTTALLIEEVDTTLQKGRLGKYLVKSSSDYNSRVNEILHKHFGTGTEEAENEILPTEYTLYQNYPNPFNPATTIKYDLPNVSEVSLIIYDILGREVKDLVNTKQPAGRYEIKFNASPLASGIYIYQLIAEKFISSKKMILLK